MMKTVFIVALFALATAQQGIISQFFTELKSQAAQQNITELAEIEFPEHFLDAVDHMIVAEVAASCGSLPSGLGMTDGDPISYNQIYGNLNKMVSSCSNVDSIASIARGLGYDAISIFVKYASIRVCCRGRASSSYDVIKSCISSNLVACFASPLMQTAAGLINQYFFSKSTVAVSNAWDIAEGFLNQTINAATSCGESKLKSLLGSNWFSYVKSFMKEGLSKGFVGAIKGLLSSVIGGLIVSVASGGVGSIMVVSKWAARLISFWFSCSGVVKAAVSSVASLAWSLVTAKSGASYTSCPLSGPVSAVVKVAYCGLLKETGYSACNGPSWWARQNLYYSGALRLF